MGQVYTHVASLIDWPFVFHQLIGWVKLYTQIWLDVLKPDLMESRSRDIVLKWPYRFEFSLWWNKFLLISGGFQI